MNHEVPAREKTVNTADTIFYNLSKMDLFLSQGASSGRKHKMKIIIRQYGKDDTVMVRQLMHELGYPLEEDELIFNIDLIHKRNGIIFVAEVDGKVVGCLGAVIHVGLAEGMIGEVVSLVVSSEYRGSGIGKRLIERVEEWFQPQVKTIRIRANVIRLEAHEFYRSLGYKEVKRQVSFMKSV